ncbi:MAG: elongation factor Ts [Ignavibacteria bacterium]|nr:MAG: elongation factor Ts [Ignavibacteria bacterium]
MEITASMVKELRDKTGAGMMDCKKALNENDGDMQLAIEYLRKKGAATAEKRADRSAEEGVVLTDIENGDGIIVEVNCETDFVARSDDFLALANRALNVVKNAKPQDVDTLLQTKSDDLSMADHLQETIGKIGEKIEVRRFATFNTDGVIIDYIHPGAKLGVMLEIAGAASGEEITTLGKDLAMQIAAMNPVSIDRDSVPQDVRDKELELYKQQAVEQGKPENLVERIAEGKLNKYFQEFTLMEQTFLRDTTKSVGEHVAEIGKSVGAELTIKRFERFQVGG